MAASIQNFRTTLYGFNRDDVVQYLENVTRKNEAKVAQLRDDLNRSQQEAEGLRQQLADQTAKALSPQHMEELELELELNRQEVERLQGQAEELSAAQKELAAAKRDLDAMSKRVQDQHQELEKLQKELAQTAQALEAANRQLAQVPPAPDYASRELEAYRRAEETERRAGQRAESLFQQAAGTVADAALGLERSCSDIDRTAREAMTALEALQAAIREGQTTLTRTADSLRRQKAE